MIITFVFIISRFYKNLLGDEGYLMFTIPVKPFYHILSKLIVAMGLIVVNVLFVVLSVVIISYSQGLFELISQAWQAFVGFNADLIGINKWGLLAEVAALIFFGSLYFISTIYASLSIAQLASSKRIPIAIGVYIGIYAIVQTINATLIQILIAPMFAPTSIAFSTQIASINSILILQIVLYAVLTAVCIAVTNYILSKRLNLQ